MKNKTQILLLGSSHFMEDENLDLYTNEVQEKINDLVMRLSDFKPEKIAVEAPYQAQDAINSAFQNVTISDFYDMSKMKNTVIGQLKIDGNTYPISFTNEAIQIGFRLGKILNHKTIYAVDYFINYAGDDEIHLKAKSENKEWYKSYKDECDKFYKNDNEYFEKVDIIEKIKYMNKEEWSNNMFNLFYLSANRVGAADNYIGANKMLMWYERNIKIFANLQSLSSDCKRILCVYGAGHLSILKEFIEKSDDMELIDVLNYI